MKSSRSLRMMCRIVIFYWDLYFTLSIEPFRQVVEINELHTADILLEYKTENFTAFVPTILFTPQHNLDQKIKTVKKFQLFIL